jgi:hypothetical protein
MDATAPVSPTGRKLRNTAAALLAAAALGAPGVAAAADQAVEIRWTQPAGEDAEGYVAHLGTQSGNYAQEVDLGAVDPDNQGVHHAYVIVDTDLSWVVALSAYNAAGESPLSNEIALAPAACTEAGCDDDNPCTADSCDGAVCANDLVENGTSCLDGEVIGQCLGGSCEPVACISDADCGAATGCAAPVCVPSFGCMAILQPDKTRCDDGLAWTKKDRCDAGMCVGKKRKGLRGKRPRSSS